MRIKLKKKIFVLAIFLFVICSIPLLITNSSAWNNGDLNDQYFGVRFGSHDWIAYKAYSFLPVEYQTWLNNNMEAYLRGTAAPDNSSENYGSLWGYGDTTLHHNYYNPDGSASDHSAATRAQQEYDKAINAIASGKYEEAAWYAGCMTHYIADVGVWGHVMTNETHHSDFESSANNRMDDPNETYFQIVFDGSYDSLTAYQASLDVGWEDYRGDVSWQYNCTWLDINYHFFDGVHPDDDFERRIEYIIELLVNKITDLLYTLSTYKTSPPPIPGFEFIISGFAIFSIIMIYQASKMKNRAKLEI